MLEVPSWERMFLSALYCKDLWIVHHLLSFRTYSTTFWILLYLQGEVQDKRCKEVLQLWIAADTKVQYKSSAAEVRKGAEIQEIAAEIRAGRMLEAAVI